MNYSIVNEFANANEAALKVFNCQDKSVTGGIINCCTFRQKQFHGFLFFYKKDYETGSIPKYSLSKEKLIIPLFISRKTPRVPYFLNFFP